MNTAQLKTKVEELELTLNAVELNAKNLKDDLDIALRQLANANKPKITETTVDKIRDAVQYVLENYDFNRPEAYEYDFEIGYGNTIELSNIEFHSLDDMAENICEVVEDLFNIVKEDDE